MTLRDCLEQGHNVELHHYLVAKRAYEWRYTLGPGGEIDPNSEQVDGLSLDPEHDSRVICFTCNAEYLVEIDDFNDKQIPSQYLDQEPIHSPVGPERIT